MYDLSQWEKALLCNAFSHWLSPYTEWSLLDVWFSRCAFDVETGLFSQNLSILWLLMPWLLDLFGINSQGTESIGFMDPCFSWGMFFYPPTLFQCKEMLENVDEYLFHFCDVNIFCLFYISSDMFSNRRPCYMIKWLWQHAIMFIMSLTPHAMSRNHDFVLSVCLVTIRMDSIRDVIVTLSAVLQDFLVSCFWCLVIFKNRLVWWAKTVSLMTEHFEQIMVDRIFADIEG